MRHSFRSIWRKGVACYAPTLVLLLAGCAPAPTAAPIETATVKPLVTETETPESTVTTRPTDSPTITSRPWPTPTPLPVPYPERHCGPYSFSPYGDWVAWTVCPAVYPVLSVEKIDQTITWVADFDFESINLDGSFDPVKWSEDGKYLYFRISSGGDAAYSFNFADYFRRMDLSNGEIIDIVPPDKYPWIVFSFSPRENEFVYIPGFGPELKIILHDLLTSTEQEISLGLYPNFSPSDIVWSPDGTRIAFGIEKRGEGEGIEIFVVDLLTLTGKAIVEIDYARARPKKWLTDFEVELDLGGANEVLNIETGELVPATSQP